MAHNEDLYFGADESDKLVAYLQKKSTAWFDTMILNDYLSKLKRSWQAYHGVYYENAHSISFGGETGELVNIAVNHYRNIASHILTMVTATRPAFQARAINTDAKSQIQTNLANGLLEYYMRDKRLESDLKKAVEYAIVLGSGYIKMEWNSTTGEIHDYLEPEYETEIDPETGEEMMVLDAQGNPIVKTEGFPIYEGDVEFSVLSPFDVVFDSTKENSKHDWQLCRSFKNKYDLAAKYPDLADKIKSLKTRSDEQKTKISISSYDETCDVPVYEFFHRRTESLPRGRYVLYLEKDIVLIDSVLPYRNLPIFRIAPSDYLGTPFGYTSMFDLLPLQDATNSLYSTIMTNQNAFGVQNVVVERGADISTTELSGGLNVIEINPGTAAPQSLNLTNTPAEIFNFVQILEKAMETISGVNSVARGDPQASLKSGNALALVQSQALQFISGLQQSYIQLIEDVGTNLVQLLQDFAAVPRIANISGKSNTTYMKDFTGKDLSKINRVIVDAGNALSQSTAGRVEMASQMMQMGIIKTPEQYLAVINTGKLETMTEGQNKELLLVRAEKERLIDGNSPVVAVLTDDHSLHIREHSSVLADPDLRMDPELVNRTLSHIQEHINILKDPNVADILSMMGQQPLSPPMNAVSPENAAPQDPNQQGQEAVPGLLENPEAQTVSTEQQMGPLPAPASPPPVNNGQQEVAQPTNPQDLAIKNQGG